MNPEFETGSRRGVTEKIFQCWRGGVPFFLSLLLLLGVTGCASTKVNDRHILAGGKLPRPGEIWVYDFSMSPADVLPNSALAGKLSLPATEPTSEQAELGQKLGVAIARQLVVEIQKTGLAADVADQDTRPAVNDLVIRGYLVSVKPGSTAKRVILGFGAGGSELAVTVDVFQMTDQGLRELGYGSMDAAGSKGPGATLGAAGLLLTANPIGLVVSGGLKLYGEASGNATIEGRAKQTAKELGVRAKKRFQQQGWIP